MNRTKKPVMKKLLYCLFLSCPLLLSAQTDEAPARRMQNQVGFDATAFIKQFIVFNNFQILNTNPYAFNYKALWYGQKGMTYMGARAGVGLQNSSSSSNPDENTHRTTSSSHISARVGFERQHVITKSWYLYYGLDVMYSKLYDKSETVFKSHPSAPNGFKTYSRGLQESKGAGPIMGIQFNINRRLCLSTEASFFLTETTAKFKSESTFPGAQNQPEDVTKIESLGFILPTFINFNIKL